MPSSYKRASVRMHLSAQSRSFDSSWQVHTAGKELVVVELFVLSLSDTFLPPLRTIPPRKQSTGKHAAPGVTAGQNGVYSPRDTAPVSGVAVSYRRAEHGLLHDVACLTHP